MLIFLDKRDDLGQVLAGEAILEEPHAVLRHSLDWASLRLLVHVGIVCFFVLWRCGPVAVGASAAKVDGTGDEGRGREKD